MKAILVIDEMPRVCDDCPLSYFAHPDDWEDDTLYCKAHRGLIELGKIGRAVWCPLKPMPEKKPVSYHDGLFGDVEKNYTNIGWNACLREMLEGNDESI